MPLHSNYTANLADGKEFEEFVFDTLMYERRLIVGGYKSRHYQTLHGESLTGVEVKLDKMFRYTQRLFIETAERACQDEEMKPAGIYHASNPWLIVIGDFNTFWVICTNTLRNLEQSGGYAPSSTATSCGYLLPLADADRHCGIRWDA